MGAGRGTGMVAQADCIDRALQPPRLLTLALHTAVWICGHPVWCQYAKRHN